MSSIRRLTDGAKKNVFFFRVHTSVFACFSEKPLTSHHTLRNQPLKISVSANNRSTSAPTRAVVLPSPAHPGSPR